MLYIVSTPIGNLDDITLRALKVLREADLVLTEDTRRTGLLFQHFEIPHKPFLSFYDEVEAERIIEVLVHLQSDKKIALVSDAGTPLISDPGYKLVRACVERGIKVEAIPGASAVVAALTVSGLPPDKFWFLGFLPEKSGHQEKLLQGVKEATGHVPTTVAFYASPYKLLRNLETLESVFGDIQIVIARELTKLHEEIWRGKISLARVELSKPKGEIVVLFNPARND